MDILFNLCGENKLISVPSEILMKSLLMGEKSIGTHIILYIGLSNAILHRLLLAGHAIECGWFLLQTALKQGDTCLQGKAIHDFMEVPFNLGWDKKDGGIFYFLDVDGHSPTQLEWSQKLWWPHNEAMVSFLMAYSVTGDVKHFDRFRLVMDYSYKHVS